MDLLTKTFFYGMFFTKEELKDIKLSKRSKHIFSKTLSFTLQEGGSLVIYGPFYPFFIKEGLVVFEEYYGSSPPFIKIPVSSFQEKTLQSIKEKIAKQIEEKLTK